jgi:hypothetical protein
MSKPSHDKDIGGKTPSGNTAPRRDDRPCQCCGGINPVWFADNEVWNAVFPERTGYVCPNCFINLADPIIPNTGWKLVPEVAAQRGDSIVGRTANEPHRPLVCFVCANPFPVTFNFCLEHKNEYERLKAAATAQSKPVKWHTCPSCGEVYADGVECDLC